MNTLSKRLLPVVVAGFLTACGGSSSNNTVTTPDPVVTDPTPPMEYHYQVTVTNLTNAQPLSPLALLLHENEQLWQIGEPASEMLETLAESGDNSAVMAAGFAVASATNGEVLMPGMQAQLMVMTTQMTASKLSLATMLVNTNDAFSGLNALDVSGLEVGQMMMVKSHVYDAGTEVNDEMADAIPGPAAGGEGFNAARDDVNKVAMHPGVVGGDDGLASSVLTNQHKFDNPAMAIKIMRMQ